VRRLTDNPRMNRSQRWLALDASTDTLSVAVGHGGANGCLAHHTGPGGAKTSTTLLPAVHALLGQAGCTLAALEAIAFGRGPGSFTGLRTACAIAQGLAYGTRRQAEDNALPLLPVDTLLALAETAALQRAQAARPPTAWIAAMLDARMGEIYVAVYAVGPQGLSLAPLQPPALCAPAELGAYLQQSLQVEPMRGAGHGLLAGNAWEICRSTGSTIGCEHEPALPSAAAMLRLAPRLMGAGGAVAARDALPLYVRDKVARTTAEREAMR
jgi:tRNA threonylcarbamoyladenosine biosynthesis protein TsaB